MAHHFCFFKMFTRSGTVVIAAIAIAVSWAPAAVAQTTGASTAETLKWGLGAGVIVYQKAYRDIDRSVIGLPLISYENKWISASVPTLDLKLFSGESVSWRLRARYAGDGYEADDSPFLAGMDERKGSMWVGGAVIWKTGIANVSAELLADALGNSKGTRAKLQADRRFALGSFGITPLLAAEWVDSKFVEYYYGVKTSEVRSGRGFYEGDATANIEGGVRVDYTPTRHHTLFLDLRATQFGSGIKDSPLVDQSHQTAISLGYLYHF